MQKLRYILYTYLTGILLFTLFRLVESWLYCSSAATAPDMEGLYWQALFMGWRFDTTVSGYLLILPLLLVLVGIWVPVRAKGYYLVAHHLAVTLYIVAFFACAADIPYFLFFFTRLNIMSLAWFDSPAIVLGMILSEPSYIACLLAFVALAVGYWFWMRRLARRLLFVETPRPAVAKGIVLTLSVLLLCFAAMRGRVFKKTPIRVGTAYFCNNAFLNQIGLNPVFSFIKSAEEAGKQRNRHLELMDPAEASRIAGEERAADIVPDGEIRLPDGMNVVVVVMESMACSKVGFFHPDSTSLTPCLDGILRDALVFDSAYSSGIHTYNGVYSAIYGHPALLRQNVMKRTVPLSLCGLPQQLRAAGYQTFFLITHDEGFDNIGGFLRANGIERVVSQSDYPHREVAGTWGVPDHILFQHALQTIAERDTSRPFLTVVLTCSDHAPYILPDDIHFQPASDKLKQQIVEYADWSVGRFMAAARECDWFDNTLFVFVADHGASSVSPYDMSLTYNHIPLAFYCPRYIPSGRVGRLALQIDLVATTLGMVLPESDNNTLGVDLLHQRRPYAFFGADDKIGVVDGEYLYIYRADQHSESLYRYRDGGRRDCIAAQPERAAAMRRYAFGMMQESQQMILENRTACR